MAKPGFRSGGGGGPGRGGRTNSGKLDTSSGPGIVRSPFSQAQIMHLMRGEFSRARRYKLPLSCLVLRVDRLDALTETHGSELRSVVIRELSRLLAEKLRVADQLGSLHESSFLVLLPHTTALQAGLVAARVATAFGNLMIEIDGQRVPLTLSIGVAAMQDQDTLFFDSLLAQAEVALEWATEAGGNQVSVFERDRYLKSGGAPDDGSKA